MSTITVTVLITIIIIVASVVNIDKTAYCCHIQSYYNNILFIIYPLYNVINVIVDFFVTLFVSCFRFNFEFQVN